MYEYRLMVMCFKSISEIKYREFVTSAKNDFEMNMASEVNFFSGL